MTLDVKTITAVIFVLSVPKVVEPGAEHVRQGRKGADVTTQVAAVFGVVAVGFDHHRHRVPAHVGAQSLFYFNVARAMGLLARLDRVDVASIGRERHVDAALTGMFEQLLQQEVRTFAALLLYHSGQSVHPFAGFLNV